MVNTQDRRGGDADTGLSGQSAAGIRDNNSSKPRQSSCLTRGHQSSSDTRMENITVNGEFPIQSMRTLLSSKCAVNPNPAPMSGLEVSVSRLLAWCDLVSLDYTGVRLCHEAEARLGQWWTEGHGLCAIIARFRPDLLQYHSLGKHE